jgi:hypothetical protein
LRLLIIAAMTVQWSVVFDGVAALGTIGATVTALTLAVRDGRRYRAERRDQEAAQARLVMIDTAGGSIGIIKVRITNHSQLPLPAVELIDARQTDGPADQTWRVPETIMNARADHYGVPAGGHVEVHVEYTSNDTGQRSQTHTVGQHTLTIRYTDAAGLQWERTDRGRPRQILSDD